MTGRRPSRAAPSGAHPTLRPSPTTTGPSGDALGEDAGQLAAVERARRSATSARRALRDGAPAHASTAASPTAAGEVARRLGHVAEQDRDQQVGAGRRVPSPVEPAAPGGLVAGHQHRAVGSARVGAPPADRRWCYRSRRPARRATTDRPATPSASTGVPRRRASMVRERHATYIGSRAPEDPDRQPRRDRRAGHPRRPRARHRRPSPSTPSSTATRSTCGSPTRRTRSAARPRPRATSTPKRSSTRSARAAPTACTPATGSSPRTPTSPGRSPTMGVDVHRPAARGDRRDGRQGLVAARRPARRRADRAGHHRVRRRARRHPWRSARPTAGRSRIKAAFGGGGRGMKVVQSAGRGRRRDGVGAARGQGVLRARRGVRRALPHVAAPRRGADRRRPARRRRVGLDPRLLGAAPPPEADRGGAGAGAARRRRGGDGRGRGQGRQGGRLLQRRHGRVHLPGRRVLLPRDEHPPPGRAPGHRGDHRHRPRRVADPGRVGRAAADDAGRGRGAPARPRASRSASTPRIRPAASSCRRPGRSTSSSPPDGFGVRFDARLRVGRRDQPVLRQPGRQADRVGPRPRDRRSPARSARSRSWWSRASPPRSPPTWRSCATPTSPRSSTRRSGSRRPSTCPASAPVGAAPRPTPTPSALVRALDDRRGQRQAVRGQAVGAASRPPSPPRRRRRAEARPRRGSGVRAGSRLGRGDRADAGHDRQGAGRGRPGRSRSARASWCSRR